jgi:hypothetical protein
MTRNTAISVAGLHKRYGDNEVLEGVDGRENLQLMADLNHLDRGRAMTVIDDLLERFELAYLDRMRELADLLADSISKAADEWEGSDSDLVAGEVVELVDSFFVDAVRVAPRLMQLLEERGWSGWTQFEPTAADAPWRAADGSVSETWRC